MKISKILSILSIALGACWLSLAQDKDPKQLIQKMVEVSGGIHKLHQLKDVQYTYIYRTTNPVKEDISVERYIFDGEYSWAKYTKSELSFGNVDGDVVQAFDGQNTWVTVNGQVSDDPDLNKRADFLRKTNYYWFAMMFKLLDPGLTYAYEGQKNLEGIDYDLVRVGFDAEVGDAQDTYLLYINPFTHLVDQFLFTVMDFGRKEPLLMRVQYQEIEGALLPSVRRYIPSNWDGEPQTDQNWTLEIMQDIQFNNGFKANMFQRP